MSTTRDIHIFESSNAGELALLSNDLVLTESLFQTIYVSLFGGNIEASTLGNEIQSEERFDYWANDLIFSANPDKQFNSLTERTLLNVPLNSSGRLKIQSAIEEDLKFLKKIVNLSIDVSVINQDRIKITLVLESIPNQADKQLQFIWDNAKQEIIIDETT